MNELGLFLFLATSFESIAAYVVKLLDWENWRDNRAAFIALFLALAGVYTLKLDVMAYLGFQVPYTWLTVVLTGFALGRGATFVHDLQGWMSSKYQISKSDAVVAKASEEADMVSKTSVSVESTTTNVKPKKK